MVNRINDNIYRIKISLKGNPLRSLNSYIIISDDRNLLIDTGFNMPQCYEDMAAGLDELKIDMSKTDIFLTHFHSDHCGLVYKLRTPQSKVYIGEDDVSLLYGTTSYTGDSWHNFDNMYKVNGYPAEELITAQKSNPAKNLVSQKVEDVTAVKHGDEIRVGDIILKCIHTPGHTPGHMCLYEPVNKIMFTGDHILFDITPNITSWPSLKNALGCYIENLKKMYDYDVLITLPSHRSVKGTMKERIDGLLKHHEQRLLETEEIVRRGNGVNVYDTASKLKWAIRARSWEEFPPVQKWFAFGETMSHIEYLECAGIIYKKEINGIYHYYIK